MKIEKFRIKNYKSIIDSGDCYFSDRLTILAGQNESGKTSILEALEDFHQDRTIREQAVPIKVGGKPEISVSFILSDSEIKEIFDEIGEKNTSSKGVTISLIKKYELKEYTLDITSREQIGLPNIYTSCKRKIIDSIKKIEKLVQVSGATVQFPKLEKQLLRDYKAEAVAFKEQNPGLGDVVVEIGNIENASDEYYAREKLVKDFVNKFVESKLPYFILFSSFDDEFPANIKVALLADDQWAKDLEQVSDFSIKKMSSVNQQEQTRHENSVNVNFSKKFKKYWTQANITLQVKKDGEKINFWIIEDDEPYFPNQRSKGQQWYLSFYVKIIARLKESKPNIILIDEPGLYLHAKAQKDLLLVLLDHTKENPVVFSTHSPYLITEDNLENVRLVEKSKKEGTKILGKIHAHPTADKETLTPILTAIGLGVNDSITNLDQKDNVIVEGPEDVFYLRAFKELERDSLKTNFVNGGGAPNMGIVGAVLEGWGANVYYLYDNDQGKKDGSKKLKEWRILPELIKSVLKTEGTTIVDVLSLNDFKKFVLDESSLSYASPNSVYIKSLNPKPDKVLLARKFLQKVRSDSINLDKDSKQNIANLFDELDFGKSKEG